MLLLLLLFSVRANGVELHGIKIYTYYMKQHIVPTSPKSEYRQAREQKNQEKKKMGLRARSGANPHLVFTVIVVTLLFGTTAGLFGFFIAANIPTHWPLVGDLNIVALLEEQRDDVLLSTRRQKQSIVYQSPHVVDQIVSVYSVPPTVSEPGFFLGNAVILTSDGWLVMPSSLYSPGASVVLPDRSTHTIQERVVDELTGLTYFKILAENLSVVNFAESSPLLAGQSVSTIQKELGSYVVYERRIAGEFQRSNAVRSTSRLEQFALLDPNGDAEQIGSPVFLNSGKLVGLIGENGVVIHSALISSVLEDVVSKKTIRHSTIDIDYVNIQRLTREEKQALALPDNGIYIVAVRKIKKESTIENSSTQDTLKAGDVITSINNAFVDQNADLAHAVHSTSVSESLFLTIIRSGTEQPLELHLE